MPQAEPAASPRCFYTLGHSNRTLDALIDLLQRNGVQILVDIRAFPHSRANPQFNIEVLPASLAAHGMTYRCLPALGGRRHKQLADSPNAAWKNASFRNYADYMLTEPFAEGLAELIALASEGQVAYFCSEVLPWRCHRRLVSDALVARGHRVFDILDASPREHRLTPFAVVVGSQVTYPAKGS